MLTIFSIQVGFLNGSGFSMQIIFEGNFSIEAIFFI
jgi:hypothetical protein